MFQLGKKYGLIENLQKLQAYLGNKYYVSYVQGIGLLTVKVRKDELMTICGDYFKIDSSYIMFYDYKGNETGHLQIPLKKELILNSLEGKNSHKSLPKKSIKKIVNPEVMF